ncbi:hypothetical protein [Streptomyces sp. NBC_00878]|uniref:hypothetical protein n=1 Tax=Streptomyces sp. NBC_00878 TaxID=2975854 RepID=UPI00225825A2|nr:hypothetical protein [Streptomyces sp. NBC_00878]MCX4908060.1 hypothetical protein [Streptomyces sp. NBC_00878]
MSTPPKKPAYPGRPALDEANMRFRRGLSRLHREAGRHDPALMPKLTAIVQRATEQLLALAVEAEQAEDSSARHRAGLKKEEDKVRAVLRRGVRRGDARAVSMLERLNERARLRTVDDGPDGDDVA